MVVAVVDYGAGNITSVVQALEHCGAGARVAGCAGALTEADAIVIPGVGHFGRTRSIDDEMRSAIHAAAGRGVPTLGICLGMQFLFEGSEEAPGLRGLGLFPGVCTHLRAVSSELKVPHVGWNTLDGLNGRSRLLAQVPTRPWLYFTHTFAAPVIADTTAVTSHGGTFSSVVERGGLAGVQAHAEKSGATGLRLLANFLAGARRG